MMSDPAVEAAQRAWDALPEQSYATREQVMEAFAPLIFSTEELER